jgi:hypothetical protein
MTEEDLKRFWDKVNKTDSCWLWTAGCFQGGYGAFQLDGRTRRAHKLSWEITNGPVAAGLQVMHNCPGGDNPKCVNPTHLLLGTPDDHGKDRAKKGQAAKGERHGSRTHPEKLARGEKNGRYTKPESTLRGNNHPRRLHPEKWDGCMAGEKHGNTKITWRIAREIRRLYATGEFTHQNLSDTFGIHISGIGKIIRNETWKVEYDPENKIATIP